MNKRELKVKQANDYKNAVYMNNGADKSKHIKGTLYGGQFNGADGITAELWASGIDSTKKTLAKQGRADLLKSIDGLTKSGGIFSIVEVKTQGADLSALYRHKERFGTYGADAIIYYLRKPYQTPKQRENGLPLPCFPVICTVEKFLDGVEKYALRKNKKNGKNPARMRQAVDENGVKLWKFDENGCPVLDENGCPVPVLVQTVKTHTIEPNSPKWTAFVESLCVYSPLHHYTKAELDGLAEFDITQEDYNSICQLWNMTV